MLRSAQSKRTHYAVAESSARQAVADLMLDKSIPASDKRIEEARKAVETNGSIHEQLVVWCHEFIRHPEREYFLALGDVVFFGITDSEE
ncbi:MAG: hypothetical protein P4L67_04370 [Candidatus Pacebacteria bacterium]|nr:hypothetical protein [Candidatus Paceibacterota bacterium]